MCRNPSNIAARCLPWAGRNSPVPRRPLWLPTYGVLAIRLPQAARRPPAELHIPGEKIYPESITSTADGRVIIGSIGARTIYVVKPGEEQLSALFGSPDPHPVEKPFHATAVEVGNR